MTSVKFQVTETVLAFALVVLLAVALKRRGVITQEDGSRFAQLLTQVVLPAVIFSQLATHQITSQQFLMVLAMGLQPLLASTQATLYHLSAEQQQVLVLISSMPSAVLGTVFATRFQCDSETAASLVFVNILLSIVAIPAVFGALVG